MGKVGQSQYRLQKWLDYENFANGIGSRKNNSSGAYNEFEEKYQPGHGRKGFCLNRFYVPRSDCVSFSSGYVDEKLFSKYIRRNKVLFPVHPQALKNPSLYKIAQIARLRFKSKKAIPTASTRTVFIDRSSPPHCVKLHSHLVVTRWTREVKAHSISHAVKITAIFEKTRVFEDIKKVAYFPESLGAALGYGENDWGYIVREMQAKPFVKRLKDAQMIPLNTLYCVNHKRSSSTPKLVKLIKKSGIEPKKYVVQKLIMPLLLGWIKVYEKTGVLLEPHGQNVCVQLKKSKPARFIFRDFDTPVNLEHYSKTGLNTNGLDGSTCFTNMDNVDGFPRGTLLSLFLDQSVRSMLDSVAEVTNEHFGVSVSDIQKSVRRRLQKKAPAFLSEFPEDGRIFSYVIRGKQCILDSKIEKNPWRSDP